MLDINVTQDRIKGERVNPPYRTYSKGNPLRLFLDMVPSSSADVNGALRGLSQNDLR